MPGRRFRHRLAPQARPLPPPFETVAGKLVYGGRALARTPEGMVAFVAGALPGERVLARPVSARKGYLECEAARILSPSPDRIEPCAPEIPGCVYSALAYPAEAQAKAAQLGEALARAVRASRCGGAAPQVAVHPCPRPLHYRNKTVLHVARADGGIVMGYRAEPSHRIVPVRECPLSREEVNRAIAAVSRGFAERIPPGSDVVFRHASQSGTVWFAPGFPPSREILVERTAGIDFKVSARGFYQVNPYAGEMLVRAVAEDFARERRGALYDLYCGVGVFGIACAKAAVDAGLPAPALYGAECSADAVACARLNAEAAGVAARFAACDASAAARDLARASGGYIVADPPRGGFGPGVAEALAASGAERVACVSCDPATLSRDLAPLLARYDMESAAMFDMFPRTARFESLVFLRRRA